MSRVRLGATAIMVLAAMFGLSPTHARGATVNINMVGGMRFEPAVVAINAGDVVRWTNTTAALFHDTVSAEPDDPAAGELWNSPLLGPGEFFSRTFQAGQTSDFFCSIHDTRMFGRVFVNGTGVQGTMVPADTTITNLKITFDIWVLNFTSASQSGNVQVKVKAPNGTTVTALDMDGTIGPGGRVRTPFTIPVPAAAPPGAYVVTLELRNAAGTLLSSDQDSYAKVTIDSEAGIPAPEPRTEGGSRARD